MNHFETKDVIDESSPCTDKDNVQDESSNRLLLITGLSGAGKSTVLRSLEDLNFETIDNIPLQFLLELVSSNTDNSRNTAVGIDTRNRDFSPEYFLDVINDTKKQGLIQVELIFLECQEDVLIRRFSETRRRHPVNKFSLIVDNIEHERVLVNPLKEHADFVIDTSFLNVPSLRNWIHSNIAPLDFHNNLSITIRSFSYKTGVPRDADLVFDVRFLRNPYYEDHLRPFNGTNADVGAYVAQDKSYEPFFTSLGQMLLPLIPRYKEEGKTYLTIALGCTGGTHRSVYVAEQLALLLSEHDYNPSVVHRDMPR
ncbi:MAG: RNase adapter RapZ [Rickettsiales bacterium]|nr:RNase adapter RapZ [Rickettsiales bacterium]